MVSGFGAIGLSQVLPHTYPVNQMQNNPCIVTKDDLKKMFASRNPTRAQEVESIAPFFLLKDVNYIDRFSIQSDSQEGIYNNPSHKEPSTNYR